MTGSSSFRSASFYTQAETACHWTSLLHLTVKLCPSLAVGLVAEAGVPAVRVSAGAHLVSGAHSALGRSRCFVFRDTKNGPIMRLAWFALRVLSQGRVFRR